MVFKYGLTISNKMKNDRNNRNNGSYDEDDNIFFKIIVWYI